MPIKKKRKSSFSVPSSEVKGYTFVGLDPIVPPRSDRMRETMREKYGDHKTYEWMSGHQIYLYNRVHTKLMKAIKRKERHSGIRYIYAYELVNRLIDRAIDAGEI